MQTSLQLHTSERRQKHKYTCETTAFADDSVLIAHSAEEIQRIVDAFANASSKFGLKINIKKTEVMFQPNSTMTMEENINVDETTLTHVKEFTYLGSIIASDGHIEAELQKRMAMASRSFGRLRERLWNNLNVSIRVKVKIYRAIILSTLLYGAETWTVYRRHVKKLHAWLQTTQPTSGGAVTANSNCCANCVEPPRPQQWGPDLPFFWHAGHADQLDGWRCCSQKRVMSRPIQVRKLQTRKSGFVISAINKYMSESRYP